jgi:hypothetical protein
VRGDVVSQDHLLAVNSNLRADVLGFLFIVPGQDLDLYTVAPQGGDEFGRLGLFGIKGIR